MPGPGTRHSRRPATRPAAARASDQSGRAARPAADRASHRLRRSLRATVAGRTGCGYVASTPPQYLDFARWEAAHWTPQRIAAQQDFWREHLADIPQTLALGGNGTAPGQHRLDFSLPQSRCDALAGLAREQGMTLFMLLLACYQLVLKQLGGQQRFLLGTDVSGRPLAAHNEVIGFFVNQLTLRCEVEGESSLGEFFQQVREQAQHAYAHQDLPFDLVVAALAPARRPGHAPLFQVKLNYQPSRSAPTLIADAQLHSLEVAQPPGISTWCWTWCTAAMASTPR
ncbi:condensation domain-containing protein [Pseudomonas poae]|uniref:condensation domain-containing protein n=1 Tax=Pseudomonas poae TaxID=200451 RepID=UPI0030DF893F